MDLFKNWFHALPISVALTLYAWSYIAVGRVRLNFPDSTNFRHIKLSLSHMECNVWHKKRVTCNGSQFFSLWSYYFKSHYPVTAYLVDLSISCYNVQLFYEIVDYNVGITVTLSPKCPTKMTWQRLATPKTIQSQTDPNTEQMYCAKIVLNSKSAFAREATQYKVFCVKIIENAKIQKM